MNILEKTRFDKRCQIVLRAENESLSKIAAIAMVVYVFAYNHEGKPNGERRPFCDKIDLFSIHPES